MIELIQLFCLYLASLTVDDIFISSFVVSNSVDSGIYVNNLVLLSIYIVLLQEMLSDTVSCPLLIIEFGYTPFTFSSHSNPITVKPSTG